MNLDGSEKTFIGSAEATVMVIEDDYGLVLDVPEEVSFEPGGEGSATVTATVKKWAESDTDTPTGDTVSDIEVTFSTSMGTIVGTNPATTGGSGTATITLTSGDPGTATISAAVPGVGKGKTAGADILFKYNNPDAFYASHICEIEQDDTAGWIEATIYVVFDKIGGDPEPSRYSVYGYGFNDTAYYGTEYSWTGPPLAFAQQGRRIDREALFDTVGFLLQTTGG